MADDGNRIARDARELAYSTPLEDFNVADVKHKIDLGISSSICLVGRQG